ncbi:hypothetical protein BLOT_003006 [Blomia tropicalis]|nr:hypothetical protein BLOT_003006 [Blomia tropicalis]
MRELGKSTLGKLRLKRSIETRQQTSNTVNYWKRLVYIPLHNRHSHSESGVIRSELGNSIIEPKRKQFVSNR